MPAPNGLDIREAGPDDAETIADLHVRSWRSAYRGWAPDDWLDSPALKDTARDYWVRLLGTPRPGLATWIAVVDGVPFGFVNVAPPLAEARDDEQVPPGFGWLHHIHLAPEAIGQGVGAALFRHALGVMQARGFAEAVLWVYGPNARARAFYEAMGWRPDGTTAPHAFPSASGDVIVTSVRYRGVTAR